MSYVDTAPVPGMLHAPHNRPTRENAPAFEADNIQVEQIEADAWDHLAAGFVDVNQEQTHCFSAARWGAGRIEHAVVRKGADVLGGAVVIVLPIPGTGSSMSLIKWGPLWRRPGMPANANRLRAVLTALKDEYANRRRHYLSIHPHADPVCGQMTEEILQDLDFSASWSLSDPDRYLVNVALTPEELKKSLSQKWRYNLKKSQANDLEISLVNSDEGLTRFMNLYREMLDRKRFFDSSAIDTLPALMRAKTASFRPEVVIVSHQGEPTAGAVIDVSGERAVYLYGATDERALGLKAGYAMHWWIAERLCNNPDIRWYDLGGKDGDSGLHQFKKGFVGKQGKILPTPPSFEYAPSLWARTLGRTVYAVRDAKAGVEHAIYRTRQMLGQ